MCNFASKLGMKMCNFAQKLGRKMCMGIFKYKVTNSLIHLPYNKHKIIYIFAVLW